MSHSCEAQTKERIGSIQLILRRFFYLFILLSTACFSFPLTGQAVTTYTYYLRTPNPENELSIPIQVYAEVIFEVDFDAEWIDVTVNPRDDDEGGPFIPAGNFGLDKFFFHRSPIWNVLTAERIVNLPTGWDAMVSADPEDDFQADGFGVINTSLAGKREDPLKFSIDLGDLGLNPEDLIPDNFLARNELGQKLVTHIGGIASVTGSGFPFDPEENYSVWLGDNPPGVFYTPLIRVADGRNIPLGTEGVTEFDVDIYGEVTRTEFRTETTTIEGEDITKLFLVKEEDILLNFEAVGADSAGLYARFTDAGVNSLKSHALSEDPGSLIEFKITKRFPDNTVETKTLVFESEWYYAIGDPFSDEKNIVYFFATTEFFDENSTFKPEPGSSLAFEVIIKNTQAIFGPSSTYDDILQNDPNTGDAITGNNYARLSGDPPFPPVVPEIPGGFLPLFAFLLIGAVFSLRQHFLIGREI